MMLDDDNVASLGRTGRVFCLVANPDEIHRRVTADAARIERPLLAGPDPRSRIIELMAERRNAYGRFTQIATDDRTPGVIAADIVAHLAADTADGTVDDVTSPAPAPAAGPPVGRDARPRMVDMTGSTYDAIAGNRDYAADFPAGHLDVRPSRRLAVITCMDSRIDVHAALGLKLGEAHVIRNAGGVVTDDVIRSVCLSQLRLDTREILVIHHTDCGIQGVEDDEILAEIEETFGERPSWRIHAFADAAEDVRRSMKRLSESPFLTLTEAISGFVFDVDTGRLEPVDG